MGADPKPTARQSRATKRERAARASEASPLPLREPPLLTDPNQQVRVGYQPRSNAADATHNALIELAQDRGDGVIKICPTEDWKVCYCYWRWSRGTYSGHYVCVMGDVYSVGALLSELLRKRAEVEEGRRKPTRDKWG